LIISVPFAPVVSPTVVEHSIRFTGAGAHFPICVEGREDCYNPILDAASGDPWIDMTSQDIAAGLLRAAGKEEAANAADALALWNRVPGTDTAGLRGLWNGVGLSDDERGAIGNQVNSGQISSDQALALVMRRICQRLDQASPPSDARERIPE
jgi:hypothetical protein